MLSNALLTGLPDEEFVRLMPLLEPVSLFAGEQLNRAGDGPAFIYFPEGAVISCHADMQDGKSAEFAMVGRDGAAGVSSLLGPRRETHTLTVSVAGSALRVKEDEFAREVRHAEGLRRALLAYAGEYLAQVAQRAACNTLHLTEQRLAVWLLMLTERLGSDTVEITQERIAQHLGVRRAGVSVIAGDLQSRGAISYTRGSLRVSDRRALEAAACECYAAMSAHGRDRVAA